MAVDHLSRIILGRCRKDYRLLYSRLWGESYKDAVLRDSPELVHALLRALGLR